MLAPKPQDFNKTICLIFLRFYYYVICFTSLSVHYYTEATRFFSYRICPAMEPPRVQDRETNPGPTVGEEGMLTNELRLILNSKTINHYLDPRIGPEVFTPHFVPKYPPLYIVLCLPPAHYLSIAGYQPLFPIPIKIIGRHLQLVLCDLDPLAPT